MLESGLTGGVRSDRTRANKILETQVADVLADLKSIVAGGENVHAREDPGNITTLIANVRHGAQDGHTDSRLSSGSESGKGPLLGNRNIALLGLLFSYMQVLGPEQHHGRNEVLFGSSLETPLPSPLEPFPPTDPSELCIVPLPSPFCPFSSSRSSSESPELSELSELELSEPPLSPLPRCVSSDRMPVSKDSTTPVVTVTALFDFLLSCLCFWLPDPSESLAMARMAKLKSRGSKCESCIAGLQQARLPAVDRGCSYFVFIDSNLSPFGILAFGGCQWRGQWEMRRVSVGPNTLWLDRGLGDVGVKVSLSLHLRIRKGLRQFMNNSQCARQGSASTALGRSWC